MTGDKCDRRQVKYDRWYVTVDKYDRCQVTCMTQTGDKLRVRGDYLELTTVAGWSVMIAARCDRWLMLGDRWGCKWEGTVEGDVWQMWQVMDGCDKVTRCRWPFQVAHVDRWLTVVTLKDNNVSGERDTASGVASSSTAVMRHFCSVVLSLACSNFHPPAPVLCFCSCCELTILILLSESQNLQPALNDKQRLFSWELNFLYHKFQHSYTSKC